MKILKIRVLSDEKGKMVYPDGLLSIHCLEHVYCDDVKNNICWFVAVYKDEDLDKIKDMTNVTILTEQEAEDFILPYDSLVEEVTDEVKIRRIEIKVKAGEKLTTDEKKALHPADPTTGIGYKKRFIDRYRARL